MTFLLASAAFLMGLAAASSPAAASVDNIGAADVEQADPLAAIRDSSDVIHDSTDAIRELSLSDAVRLALANNRDLASARATTEIARQDLAVAESRRWLRAALAAFYQRQSVVPVVPIGRFLPSIPGTPENRNLEIRLGDNNVYDARVTLSQPIFTGGAIENTISSRAAARDEAAWREAATESDIIYRTVDAYFGAIRAQRGEQIAADAVDRAEARAGDVANLFAQGMTTRDEALAMNAHVSRARVDLLEARQAASLARLALLDVLALPLNSDIRLISPADEISSRIGEQGLDLRTSPAAPVAQSDSTSPAPADSFPLPNRPEATAAASGLRAAEAALEIERAAYWPSLTGTATAAYGRPGLDFVADEWSFYWLAGFSAQWSLWDWGERRARVQAARLRIKRLNEAQQSLQEALRLEAETTRLHLVAARDRVELARELSQAAAERLRVIEDRFDAGMVTPTDLITAQRDATAAEHAASAAIADLQVAIAARERALGELTARGWEGIE